MIGTTTGSAIATSHAVRSCGGPTLCQASGSTSITVSLHDDLLKVLATSRWRCADDWVSRRKIQFEKMDRLPPSNPQGYFGPAVVEKLDPVFKSMAGQ